MPDVNDAYSQSTARVCLACGYDSLRGDGWCTTHRPHPDTQAFFQQQITMRAEAFGRAYDMLEAIREDQRLVHIEGPEGLCQACGLEWICPEWAAALNGPTEGDDRG